jgi:hypothetical protein
MAELLNAWLIEGVVILTVLMPLGLIVNGIAQLREDRRRWRERNPEGER